MVVDIRHFEPCDAQAVSALNRAWLEGYGLLEPPDEGFLADPGREIVGAGGHILVATDGDVVIGTSAILPTGPDVFELVKLAVAPAAQGRGVGRRLVEASLELARARGARRVVLISNSKLGTALRLYETLGFRRFPLPSDQPYATADVYMELGLS